MARPLSHKAYQFAYAFIKLRDGETCRFCGKAPPETPLEIDHINGNRHDDEPSNWRFLCKPCNLGARNSQSAHQSHPKEVVPEKV
jgi:hypothetical protein